MTPFPLNASMYSRWNSKKNFFFFSQNTVRLLTFLAARLTLFWSGTAIALLHFTLSGVSSTCADGTFTFALSLSSRLKFGLRFGLVPSLPIPSFDVLYIIYSLWWSAQTSLSIFCSLSLTAATRIIILIVTYWIAKYERNISIKYDTVLPTL